MSHTMMSMPPTAAGPGTMQPRRTARWSSRLRLHTLRGQFILHTGLMVLLALILTAVGAMTLNRATNDLNTINSGSIPSVDAALAITQDIEVIDAQAADYLAAAGLSTTMPCTVVGLNAPSTRQALTVHMCDERTIDAETVLVNEQLFEAAHNVTYSGEQTAVERITIGLESYLGDIHQMRVAYGQAIKKTDPTDPALQQAYQAYLQASAILHDRISLATLGSTQIPLDKEAHLPSCTLPTNQVLPPEQWTQGGLATALDCLSAINKAHLQAADDDAESFGAGSTVLVALLCGLLCLLLLIGTGRMIALSHRVLNFGLLVATLLCLIFSLNMVSVLHGLQGQGTSASQDGAFRQLVQDDYASIYDAALLKRYGTDANADESRWLIAQELKDQANSTFWQTDWERTVQHITDLMHQAHANQTWVEEIQPLKDMETFWGQYAALDPHIRSIATNLDNAQRINDAETLSTGRSNQAFGHFTDAVDRLSQANREHYLQTLNQTQGALLRDFWLCLGLFPLIGALALWGIVIRLKDF